MIEEQKESGYIEQEESGEQYSIADVKANKEAITDIVNKEAVELVNSIIISNDDNEINSYLEKFNKNMSKKNLLRILKYDELLDKVSDEALDRIENHPDELTHSEIINYIKVTQESINNAKKQDPEVDGIKPITVNQQNNTVNLNVNGDSEFRNRQSKERIMQAVSKILAACMNEEDVVDVKTDDKSENKD